ncbi:exported hypothetical protein [uncultured Paludibacter sp.]|uniref:Uncharacterized protein n=1 Tax=uncultured Paludibacter sp. TaxID=497635 RepID=A0A653A7Z9_9BACT|nr:exported hypothetical protein [uncultured Paludibacter sp.]
MKLSLIFGLLISLSNCFAQKVDNENKFGQFKYYQNDTIQKRLKDIVRTDSIKSSCDLFYKSYDRNDSLVSELKYFQCQSNTKNGYLTRNIYRKDGKIILYELFNMEGTEIERYKFDYNEKGKITKKEGFGSGEIGITIKYYYTDNGELIDKKAFRFGDEVKDYFKTMK